MTETEAEREVGTEGESVPWLLFAVFGGAIAWTIHFLGSYAVVGIACPAGWGAAVPVVLGIATLLFTGVAIWAALLALRSWRRHTGGQPWDQALSEPSSWYGFLMLTGILLGIVSVFAILLEGLPSILVPPCGVSGVPS